MKTIEQWLSDYHDDHRNLTNQIIHKICVPLIVFSILGIFFCIPFPYVSTQMSERIFANWAAVLAFFSLIFYMRLLPQLVFPFSCIVILILSLLSYWEAQHPQSLLAVNVGVFVLAWIAQFVGHKIEGKKPSFLKDMQYLLIGPLWVLYALFKKFKTP